MRTTVWQRRLLQQYEKNRESITGIERENIEKFLMEDGSINPSVQIKIPKINWSDHYRRILNDPDSVVNGVDYVRRQRLYESGYLEKTSKGYSPTGKNPEKNKTKDSLMSKLEKVQTSEDLTEFLERHHPRIKAAETLWKAYSKKRRDLNLCN